MKVLVLFSCALALTVADWAPAHHAGYHGAYHVPVIGPHGVPVDTPEVQHARAAHLAALGQASAHAGPYHGGDDHGQWNGHHGDDGQYHHQAVAHHDDGHYHEQRYHGPPAYETTHGVAKVTHDGVPLDTPEVAAAKAHHFSAFSEALSRAAYHHGPAHYRKRRSYAPWAHHGGGVYHGAIHVPVIGPHGVPVDTPEVQHARAAHFAALAAAGHGHHHGGDDGGHYYAPAVYAHGYHHHGFQGLDHDGRPLDTPEVAHAKEAHFHAYHEAAALNGVHGAHHGYAGGYAHGYGYPNGAPHDTPEVAHAKAAHFAAHAAARGHHY